MILKLPPLPSDVEIMGIEVICGGQKWLILGIYKPPNQCCKYFMENLDSCHYDNCIVMGDFKSHETDLSTLKTHYNLANLIKSSTCYKDLVNPCCIDHI